LISTEVDQLALFGSAEERFGTEFEILELVAASPERALFVVRDRVLKRRVALRVHLQPETSLRSWFERETELLAVLDHRVLRTVHAAGYRGDWAFRVVRWVDGESLADAVARGPRPIPTVLQLARSLAGLLEYVHSQHIVIRRLVPATVMIDSTERIVVTDLRYANILTDVAARPDESDVAPFIAPEARGGAVGEPGSDIYSAAALLYFATTGIAPHAEPQRISPPRAHREACPASLDRIITRGLQADPSARYLTAAELWDDLRSELGDHELERPLVAEHGGVPEDAGAWEKRLRRAMGDDYELLEELGSGAFGRVYRVRDLALEREVALKVLHPYLTADPAVVERFRREARVAAQLLHQNIANTYDIGGRAGLLWYTMEYVRGHDLGRVVRAEGPQSADHVVRILHDALAALRYAHQRGVVHRDLKPENILIDGATGTVRVADFGLALALQPSERTGVISHSGTPDFAAPEQLLGEPVDHRADLYSLSLVAFYMLTGQLPFGSARVEAILAQRTIGRLPELDRLHRRVPEAVLGVLQKGAARHPENRFDSAEAYAHALRQATRPAWNPFRGLFRTGSDPA
jgi:serine/threonine-protein kinase